MVSGGPRKAGEGECAGAIAGWPAPPGPPRHATAGKRPINGLAVPQRGHPHNPRSVGRAADSGRHHRNNCSLRPPDPRGDVRGRIRFRSASPPPPRGVEALTGHKVANAVRGAAGHTRAPRAASGSSSSGHNDQWATGGRKQSASPQRRPRTAWSASAAPAEGHVGCWTSLRRPARRAAAVPTPQWLADARPAALLSHTRLCRSTAAAPSQPAGEPRLLNKRQRRVNSRGCGQMHSYFS